MTRMGSGTSWLPDAVSMHAMHFKAGAWALMVHGVVFGMYDKQFGRRGDDQVNSVNWGMLMAWAEAAGHIPVGAVLFSLLLAKKLEAA